MGIDFTDEQLAYIDSSCTEHTFLEACPGSGKTEVVAYKVAKELNTWQKKPAGLAALSFANSATSELKNRISKYLPRGRSIYPHFLGTFDSFIFKNIVSPLSKDLTGYSSDNHDSSIRIVEPSANIGYATRYSYARRGKIKANHYSFDFVNDRIVFHTGEETLDRTLSAISLQDWQIRDLENAKYRMLQNGGFATYRDIEFLTIRALSDERFNKYTDLLAQRFPLIIIDECQDLSEEQLIILEGLANKGSKLHFIGDLHQAIYGFREVNPEKVKQFIQDKKFSNLQLTKNFRSCQNIVDLCANLTGRKNITGTTNHPEDRCLVLQYESCPSELVTSILELCKGLENCVLVARGHSTLNKFQSVIDQPNNIQKLALAINSYNTDNMAKINESLQYFSDFLSYHLEESCSSSNFNCPHSITSNLLWRRFLHNALRYLVTHDLQKTDIKWSEWTRTAKALIRQLTKQSFCPDSFGDTLTPLDGINLTSPQGCANTPVRASLNTPTRPSIGLNKTTIHGCKGETHDATIIVSSATANGDSHWKHWLRNPASEPARLAYVASSRPRELLIWVVKALKPKEAEQLKGIGFTIYQ